MSIRDDKELHTLPGVRSNNSIAWLMDEIYNDKAINLTWEAFQETNPTQEEEDGWECSGDDTILTGDWKKDEKGLYYPDPDGEYASIVGEIYTQVVFSHNIEYCALCSPCYPGQGDLESDGENPTYDLPKDIVK